MHVLPKCPVVDFRKYSTALDKTCQLRLQWQMTAKGRNVGREDPRKAERAGQSIRDCENYSAD
jgi:hypothetical protein